jgi:lysophospholipase L1-like esterase
MKTILCYGDSNTHGTLAIDFDVLETPFISSQYRLPKQKRWTGVLQSELGSKYNVIEEGLNGRTTVWDDPVEGTHKNGLKYLIPCLESHAPIDLVILMLGTNDLKVKFSVSAFDIAMGIGVLVNTIQKSGFGPDGGEPKVLILCPPPLSGLTYLKDLFGDAGIEKSKELAKHYKKIAKHYGCDFIDMADIIKPSDVDGVHYDEEDVEKLGRELVKPVKQLIG